MNISPTLACSAAIITIVLMQAALAQNQPAASTATVPAPAVAESADRMLKEVGSYIGSAEQFTFNAKIIFDHVLPSGQKLQFSASEDVALQRSGRLYVEWDGDLGARQFWYDEVSHSLRSGAPVLCDRSSSPRHRQHAGSAGAEIELFTTAGRPSLS
jgi:hypothetical protein